MDNFDLLQMFARIVETGSLTSVARERQMTQPAVSKRLQQLERSFGTRLLQRNTQGVRPTEAGERLYQEGRALVERFEALRSGITSAAAGGLTGTLIISAPSAFGEHLLTPMMFEFHQKYPTLNVQLSLTDRAVDLVEDAVDVAVRLGVVRSPTVIARRLATVPYCLVATPAYLKRAGTPRRPEDLKQHTYFIPDVQAEEELIHAGGTTRFKPSGWLTVSNSGALRLVALQSAGICRLGRYLVEAELRSGKLIEVLPGTAVEPMPVSAVYLGGREAPPRVKAMVGFLAEALPRQPGLLPVMK